MKKFTKVLACVVAVMLTMLMLTACGGIADADKAKEILVKAEFEVEVRDAASLGAAPYEGLETMLMGMKGEGDTQEIVTIMYFNNKDMAKKSYNALKAIYELAPEAEKDKLETKHSGKVVVTGTKAAVKLVA